jgi:hypothetical protein
MNVGRILLNFSAVSLSTYSDMVKAKKSYVEKHPECAICGSPNCLEVHHVQPVHLFPDLACSFENFITLCDSNNNSCHRWIGHFGNFKSKYNLQVREYALRSRMFIERVDVERKFVVSTDQLIEEYAQAMNITPAAFIQKVTHYYQTLQPV